MSAQHRGVRGIPQPDDRRNPGDEYLAAEIEDNRRGERWLVLKGIVALVVVVVAALIVIREVVFL